MTDSQPDRDIFTTLAGIAGHVPVSETLRATRTAVEIAAAVTRQAHALMALQQENSRLRERLITSTAEADHERRRAQRAEAETSVLRKAIQVLAGDRSQ
jgi:regulator of replication initiation timing